MIFTHIENNILYLHGAWTKENALIILEEIIPKNQHYSKISLDNITSLDTIGAMLICKIEKIQNIEIISSTSKAWYPFFSKIEKDIEQAGIFKNHNVISTMNRANQFFYKIGYMASSAIKDTLFSLNFIGALTYTILRRKKNANHFITAKQLLTPYIANFNKLGTTAFPIIMLLSFIIGGVMAQQGAFQLRRFGAEIYVVNLTAILIFRELGVLLTAILIAGRCGSAITGELGVMHMRGEISALKIMGIDEFKKLYLPRTIAILIAMPILTLFANFSALLGASVITYIYSHISFTLFFSHLRNDLYYSTYFIGLIKAPFLALSIAVISIIESLKVSGSSTALAKHIISCVVKSIFSVIVIDAFLAIAITYAGY